MSNIEWDQLLTNLCAAERAGHEQSLQFAAWFRAERNEALADAYEGIAEEEATHTELAAAACLGERQASALAKSAYGGALLSADAELAERLAVLHLAFEPFALAFMSSVYLHMRTHLDGAEHREWVQRVRACLGPIIRDEVRHVRDGGEVARDFFLRAPAASRRTIVTSLKRHRRFLLLGARVGAQHTEHEVAFLRGIQQAFDRRFEQGLCALGVG